MGEDPLPDEADDTADENSGADSKSGTASADFSVGGFGGFRATAFRSANLFERFARNHSRSVVLHLISESVFLDFVEQCLVADAEVFGGLTLVTQICLQCAANLFAFDKTQGAMCCF